MKLDLSLYAILRRILGELNEQVVDHGDRVAYLYLKMAEYRNQIDDKHTENMMLACYTHDIGAYKTEKFLDLLNFDVTNTLEHCVYGYLFMKYFSPLKNDAEVLLYHHTHYSNRDKQNSAYIDDGVLIHLLDRIDIFNLKNHSEEELIAQISKKSGDYFNPKDVEDFILANEKYHILENLRDGTYKVDMRQYFDEPERVKRLASPIIFMLAYEIDFRSEQTVIHCITTTILSCELGKRFDLSEEDYEKLKYAAQLHDLGKVTTPTEILEKQGKLTPEEYHIMKKHVVQSEVISGDLFPRDVVRILSNHHERLDGSGYSRGLKADDLPLLDRILQVADVTSALLQRRSYKESLDKDTTIRILTEESEKGKLDSEVVNVIVNNFDDIVGETMRLSMDTIHDYENLQTEFNAYLDKYSTHEHDNKEDSFTDFFAISKN